MLESVQRKGNPLTLLWKCQLVQPLWRTVWRFLKKVEIELPYDPAIPLLGIHTEETRIERNTCSPMFIAALFTIARTQKQPRCPSADEWIRKLWYTYTMGYYSALKMNASESALTGAYYTEWSKSERERQILYINTYVWNLEWWQWWSYMQGSKGDKDVKKRLLDSVGEDEGGMMIWETKTETCILPYVK